MELELLTARDTAVEAAEAAGELVRDGLFRRLDVREKGVRGDVVTNLDFDSEKLIIKTIRARFPVHRIISEELGEIGGDGTWTWLIDPVDGTNNVAIGLPSSPSASPSATTTSRLSVWSTTLSPAGPGLRFSGGEPGIPVACLWVAARIR